MKKIITLTLAVLLVAVLAACGGEKSSKNEIPDVFGVNYTDAIEILEAEGFEVSAIESSVDSFSSKLLYPLEKVDKGTVFKIDEYIIDNNGNLNINYNISHDGELASDDKSLVIYYAKEDYVLVKNEPSVETTPSTQPATEADTEETEATTEETTEATTEATEAKKDNGSLDPEFKQFMDDYEAFMDEYVAFMEKYSKNPSDLTLLADYAKFMSDYTKFMEDFEKWEDEDMNAAELAYYIEVQTRVNEKLLKVTQ